MRLGGGGQRVPADPVAAAFVAELPTVAARPVQLAVRRARIGDRSGAGVDKNPRMVAECGRESNFDVAPHIHALGDTRCENRIGQLLLLWRAPGARGADERDSRRQGSLGLRGRSTGHILDHRSQSFAATRSHGGAGTLGAAQHATMGVANHDGRMGAAAVDAQEDGRMGGWARARFGHVVLPIRPTAHPPITSEATIPTAKVIAVPSGTYHGQASPGNQWIGKWGTTAPNTTGDMTTMLMMSAMMTSICRARGQAPPRMYVPSSEPYVSDAMLKASCTTGVF